MLSVKLTMKNEATPWRVLSERNFALFWVSLLASGIGSRISSVAIGWQIYEITNSAWQLGLTGLFRAVPVLVFSLTGGVLADRLDRRRLLIVTQGLAVLLALLLALLTQTGQIRVWHIYAIIFLSGVVNSFDQPARQAIIPNLVPREHLTTAFALNVTLRQTASLAGPFVGGVILAAAGIAWSYYINALSFVGVIACLVFMRVEQGDRPAKKESTLASMRAGLEFVWRQPVILALLVMDTCVVFFGAYDVMMPVFARDLLGVGPAGLGALLGAPAIGALVGSGLFMGWGNRAHTGRLVISVTLLYTAGIIVFAYSRSFSLSLGVVFLLGALDAVGETLRLTVIQLLTPDELRGRVQGVVRMFVFGFPTLGNAQIGAVAAFLGVPGAVALGGLIGSAVVGLVVKKAPQLRRFDI